MENDEMILPPQYAGKLDWRLDIDPSNLAGLQLLDSSSLAMSAMPKIDLARSPKVLGDTRFIYRGKPNNKPLDVYAILQPSYVATSS